MNCPSGRYPIAVLLGLTLSVAACSTLPEQRPPFPGQEPEAGVVVNATASAFIGMTVYISSTSGFRQRLGTVSVGGRDRFTVRDLRPGSHWLEGRAQGTDEIRSREFILKDGDTVEWDVESNDVFYR